MVNERSQAREPGVMFKAKAGEQHFERDLGTDMTKLCTVEVKAQGSFGAVFDTFQPQKLCVRINEASDEPGRRHTVDPQMFPCGPHASAVRLALPAWDLAMRSSRLIGRKACIERRLGINECAFHLPTRLAREEIARNDRCHFASYCRKPLPCLGLFALRKFAFKRIETTDSLL